MENANLTLEQTWTECLRMWEWITKNYKKLGLTIWKAKRVWLNENGYRSVTVRGACFFCSFAEQVVKPDRTFGTCLQCPGHLVDSTFICANAGYNWEQLPEEFYLKLLELDEIRRRD